MEHRVIGPSFSLGKAGEKPEKVMETAPETQRLLLEDEIVIHRGNNLNFLATLGFHPFCIFGIFEPAD